MARSERTIAMTFENATVLITGGTGSLGRTVIRRLLKADRGLPKRIIVFSRDEAKQYAMRMAYARRRVATEDLVYQKAHERLEFRVGDIRDWHAVVAVLQGVDVVINAAALKQVPTCEYFPYEAVQTNITGAENIVRALREQRLPVHTVVGVSTDKACKPVNVMGMTKAIQERLQKAQKLQASLQKQVTELTAETAKATGERKDTLHDQLSLAKSGLDIATSEVQDAQDDLTEAGANKMGLLQQQRQLHEDKWHRKDAQGNDQFEKDTEKLFPATAEDRDGLIYRYQQWWALRQKMKLLRTAKTHADEAATAATEEHEALAAQIDAEKFNSPDLASHSTLAGPAMWAIRQPRPG